MEHERVKGRAKGGAKGLQGAFEGGQHEQSCWNATQTTHLRLVLEDHLDPPGLGYDTDGIESAIRECLLETLKISSKGSMTTQ